MWRLNKLSFHDVAVKMNPESKLVSGDRGDIGIDGRAMCTVDKDSGGEMTWLSHQLVRPFQDLIDIAMVGSIKPPEFLLRLQPSG
jgi:hypothetical protein